jgi:hypothetical protein
LGNVDARVYDGPMLGSRFRPRSAVAMAAVACAVVAAPNSARAVDDERGRPWARGTVMPTLGFGLGLGQDLTQISFGLGASYFVWHGLSIGLSLTDRILIYSSSFKNRLPGVEDQIPTNIFRITPNAQYVFYRSRWFSPYVYAGLGPTFFNNQGGVHAHWVGGPGAYIGLGGPIFLDVGVNFTGMFPRDRCDDAFVYQAPTGERGQVLEGVCSFGWGPRIGLVLAFGGRSRGRANPRRRNSTPPPERFEVPPENPMQTQPDTWGQPEPWPEPEPEPEPESESEPEPESDSEPESASGPEPDSGFGPEPPEPVLDEPPPGFEDEPPPSE